MRDPALDRRNGIIRNQIVAMMSKKSPFGRQKYTSGYIFDFIAEEHGLKPRTVKNIFWDSGVYDVGISLAQNVAVSIH